MDFNTLLYRLGIDPSSFINRENEPIKTESGFMNRKKMIEYVLIAVAQKDI